MKNLICFLPSLSIGTTGCNKEFVCSPEPAIFSISSADGMYASDTGSSYIDGIKIGITTNPEQWQWDVVSDQDWCRMSTSDHPGNFTVYVRPDTTSAQRTATLTISADKRSSQLIQVHHAALSSRDIPPATAQYSRSVAYYIDGKYIRKGSSGGGAYTQD